MKGKWMGALQIGAVYVGTVVGAGFATGREIVEFFTRFGFIGLIGILMSGYFLIFFGAKIMRLSSRIGARSYQEFNEYLFGKYVGAVINVLTLIMLFGVTAVMLSGSGAVFEEQLGLSKLFGVSITILLAIFVIMMGLKGIFAVNNLFVPMMIIFSFILMVLSMQDTQFLERLVHIPFIEDRFQSIAAPFSYAAFNLALAQAVLVPVGNEIKDEKIVKWGGILGGIALTFILLSSHFTLMMLPNLESYDIPMAVVMKNVASAFYWIYVVVIYGEIFSSLIGDIFGLERQIKKYVPVKSIIIVLFIIAVASIISIVEYGKLLSYLYPVFGYISLLFLFLLWKKPLEEN